MKRGLAKTISSAIVVAVLLSSELSLATTTYSVINLGGSLPSHSYANSISDNGIVAGRFISTTTGSPYRAFSSADGNTTAIGTLPGKNYSEANGVNSEGVLVGSSYNSNSDSVGFMYQNGQMTSLGTLGGSTSAAYAVNNMGTIVGEARVSFQNTLHPFMYRNGVMTDLGGTGGRAFDVNNLNLAVGESYFDGKMHSFLYDGSLHDLGTLGGGTSKASAINDFGIVVGESKTSSNQTHAFIYSDGVMIDLLGDKGGIFSAAYDINDSGQILGEYSSNTFSQTHSFLYDLEADTFTDLKFLPEVINAGFNYFVASAINDLGQIIGYGANKNTGIQQALLLNPNVIIDPPPIIIDPPVSAVPAPPAFILMLTGLGVLGLTKRFRKADKQA
jgi:probable HAF family extracellular repeat protein